MEFLLKIVSRDKDYVQMMRLMELLDMHLHNVRYSFLDASILDHDVKWTKAERCDGVLSVGLEGVYFVREF